MNPADTLTPMLVVLIDEVQRGALRAVGERSPALAENDSPPHTILGRPRRYPHVAQPLICDLEHKRAVAATVRLEIKSTRAGKPGHPMIRMISVCRAHARQLRGLGLEMVQG